MLIHISFLYLKVMKKELKIARYEKLPNTYLVYIVSSTLKYLTSPHHISSLNHLHFWDKVRVCKKCGAEHILKDGKWEKTCKGGENCNTDL